MKLNLTDARLLLNLPIQKHPVKVVNLRDKN
jgi:hypothetical protein